MKTLPRFQAVETSEGRKPLRYKPIHIKDNETIAASSFMDDLISGATDDFKTAVAAFNQTELIDEVEARDRQTYDPHRSAFEEPMLSDDNGNRLVENINTASALHLTNDQLKDMQSQPGSYFLGGYDCKRPKGITATSSVIIGKCSIPDIGKVKQSDEREFQVVQTKTKTELKGYRCKRTVTQMTSYCGTYDHSTPIPQHTFFQEPVRVSSAECWSMGINKVYRDLQGKDHQITPGIEIAISYFKLGNTRGSEGIDGNQVRCTGGQFMIDNVLVDRTVIYVRERIKLQEEIFVERKDHSLIATYDNLRLDCKKEDKLCQAGKTSYVWHLDEQDNCEVGYVNVFRGSVTSADSVTDKIVMSTDGSLQRFILRGQTEKCGRSVFRTNYPEIFLYEMTSDANIKTNPFQTKLDHSERKLALFVTNRDDYLYHRLKNQLREEFSDVWRHDCQRRFEDTKTTHYMSREMPGFHTYRIGGNTFLTTAGEVVYTYKCKPVLLQALQTKRCYDALPVRVLDDEHLYEEAPSDDTPPESFLEPLTHRLTQISAALPCRPGFHARYQDIFGRWFSVSPTLLEAGEPGDITIVEKLQNSSLHITPDEDFSQNGIYSNKELDELQAYLEFGRKERVLTYKLTEQASYSHPDSFITPGILFPNNVVPGGSWPTFVMGRVWGWLRSFGEITSIIVALVFIIRLLWYLAKVSCSCYHIHSVDGCSPNLAWSFCSDVFFHTSLSQS